MRLLFADDLTGCCDAGIQFANGGAVLAAISPLSLSIPGEPCAMLALNTASRLLAPDAAADITRTLAQRLRTRYGSPDFIFKKVDSTMRGHPGLETAALMDAFNLGCGFIAPAYPAQGRVVKNGFLLVNGRLVHETDFANDPVTPVTESSLLQIFGSDVGKKAAVLPVAKSGIGLGAQVKALIREGIRFLIFDSQDEADLVQIAKIGLEMEKMPLFVGSAGLAQAFAGLLAPTGHADTALLHAERVLFICGSAHPSTCAQIAVLESSGVPVLRLPPDFKAAESQVAVEAANILRQRSVVVAAPLERLDSGPSVSIALAETALQILAASQDQEFALCISGGETAYAILGRIASYMLLQCELYPGVVAAILADGDRAGSIAVTKAGGFGEPSALLDIMRTLGQQDKK